MAISYNYPINYFFIGRAIGVDRDINNFCSNIFTIIKNLWS